MHPPSQSLAFQKLLDFWFGHPDDPNYGKPRKEWFTKNPDFDREVRSHFLADYDLARSGQLDSWQQFPLSCLALIILLDQFPRNVFRSMPQAFASDPQALKVAKHAIGLNFDRELMTVQKWFIYLPFEHSENLEDQRRSVALFQKISEDPESGNTLDYAIRHLEIIEKFGRFPHRNQILGRETTAEEAEFLKQPGSHF